jgi:hypothetical protein
MNTRTKPPVDLIIGAVVSKGWDKETNRVGVVPVQRVAPRSGLKKMSGVLLSALVMIGMFQVVE